MLTAERAVEAVTDVLRRAPIWSRYLRGTQRAEAELLVGHVLGLDPVGGAAEAREVTRVEVDAINALLRRRIDERVPVPYLVGFTTYDGVRLEITPELFIARNAVEYVVDELVAAVPWGDDPRMLDLCCGIGAVGVAVARRHASVRVDQADVDAHAVDVAGRNAKRHGFDRRREGFVGDLLAAVPGGRRYDLITVNPPYVPDRVEATTCPEVLAEPGVAVFSSGDGLALTRAVVAGAADHLTDAGVLALECAPGQRDHLDWMLAGRGRWWTYAGRQLHLVSITRADLVH